MYIDYDASQSNPNPNREMEMFAIQEKDSNNPAKFVGLTGEVGEGLRGVSEWVTDPKEAFLYSRVKDAEIMCKCCNDDPDDPNVYEVYRLKGTDVEEVIALEGYPDLLRCGVNCGV